MIDLVKEVVNRQPLGNFDTRCDDKGRIRLPGAWLHFFTHELKDNRVFCTSLDGIVIRVYAESIWRCNLALLEEASAHSEEVEALLDTCAERDLAVHAGPFGKALLKGNKILSPLSDEAGVVLRIVQELVPTEAELGARVLRAADLRARL